MSIGVDASLKIEKMMLIEAIKDDISWLDVLATQVNSWLQELYSGLKRLDWRNRSHFLYRR
jgi:hypothetical protein